MNPNRRRQCAAFLLGYNDGQREGAPISRHQAEERNRGLDDDQVNAYLNGHDDGTRRDAWRARRVERLLSKPPHGPNIRGEDTHGR